MRFLDVRDWFVMLIIGATLGAGWTWVFIHPELPAFITIVSANATAGGIFHWICVVDDKKPDVRQEAPPA